MSLPVQSGSVILRRLVSACQREIHTSSRLDRVCAGRYRVTLNKSKPLTYEMTYLPEDIAEKKGFNSFNTAQLEDTFLRREEIGQDLPYKMLLEDSFIRRFMHGTWPEMLKSEVIIKRQHNLIRISGMIKRDDNNGGGPVDVKRRIYFLIGYTEELLSFWLKCPVRLELVTLESEDDIIYKYI